MKPTPDDHVKARRLLLWAPAGEAIAAAGLAADSYHHDHDEELGMYWYDNPAKALLDRPRRTQRDLEYWLETGKLVREYLMLQAGAAYSETLRQGFVRWLQGEPAERRRYEEGDDMQRAALVDWYLRVVRLNATY